MRPKINVLTRNNVQIKGVSDSRYTLLFAHGFGSDQSAWDDIWPAFSSDYRIILFDMVGANETTFDYFSTERYSRLSAFADDLLTIVETLDLTDVILVGHSMGGMTSVLAAIQEPYRFKGLVLVSASPRYLNGEEYTGGFNQEDLDLLFTQMTGNYYAWASGFAPYITQNASSPQIASRFAETLRNMRPDVGLATARTIFQSDHRADLKKIPQPTLILQPQRDGAVPVQVGHYMANVIPKAQLLVLPTEGHMPHMSHPEDVTQAIRTFIDRIPAYGLEPV